MGVGDAMGDKKLLENASGDMQKMPGKAGDHEVEEVDRGVQDPRGLSGRLMVTLRQGRCTSFSTAW